MGYNYSVVLHIVVSSDVTHCILLFLFVCCLHLELKRNTTKTEEENKQQNIIKIYYVYIDYFTNSDHTTIINIAIIIIIDNKKDSDCIFY